MYNSNRAKSLHAGTELLTPCCLEHLCAVLPLYKKRHIPLSHCILYREAAQDLNVGGVTIPKGAVVMWVLCLCCHNPVRGAWLHILEVL